MRPSSVNGTTPRSPDAQGSDTDARPRVRTPSELTEQGRAFRDLLTGTTTPRELAELAARANAKPFQPVPTASDFDTHGPLTGNTLQDASDGSMMAAVHRLVEQGATPQAVAAASAPELTFAELVEKHVRRMLASERASGASGGELHIEMSDAVLPGMALSLRRTPAGWQLVASGRNLQSRDRLQEFGPALVERFERCALGRLEIALEA